MDTSTHAGQARADNGGASLREQLAQLCLADDARGAVEVLAAKGLRPSSEADYGLTALEIAIHHDAPKTFEALARADKAAGGKGLFARVWGGSTPIHRCARWQPPEHEIDSGSPKCLAVALALDPAGPLREDERGRSVLCEAAIGPSAECFRLALAATAAAVFDLGGDSNRLADVLNAAAFDAARAKLGPKELVARLEAIDAAGGDWLKARAASGASVLGLCAVAGSVDECVALLGAGADPMDPMAIDSPFFEPKVIPCAQAFAEFDLMLWLSGPRVARALIASLDDLSLSRLGEVLRSQELAPIGSSNQSGLGLSDGRMGVYKDVLGEVLWGRFAALEEAQALSKVAEKARERRGGAAAL
jgi:hypothetical protein